MAARLTRRDALALLAGGVATITGCRRARANTVVAGSKNFTEQIILAELLSQQVEAHTGLRVDRRLNLGGTLICHQAMIAGQMDFYVEYTGTALTAVLGEASSNDTEAVYHTVRDSYRNRFGLEVGPPLGFNNTFAIVVRSEDAQRLKLRTISDLVPHASQWHAGFGYELRSPLDALGGKISEAEMRQMNYAVDAQQRDPAAVAEEFRRAWNL